MTKTTSGWKSQGCSTRVGDEMGAENRSRFAQLQRKRNKFRFKAAKESEINLDLKSRFKTAKESETNLDLKLQGIRNKFKFKAAKESKTHLDLKLQGIRIKTRPE